mgnify:CR=1 FL=1
MKVHKHCPSCDTPLPADTLWPINRETVFACESCGRFARWTTTVLVPVALGLIAVKLLVGVALGVAGLWVFLLLFVLVSIPVVSFLIYLGLQPEAVDFGRPAAGRLKEDDVHSTLH